MIRSWDIREGVRVKSPGYKTPDCKGTLTGRTRTVRGFIAEVEVLCDDDTTYWAHPYTLSLLSKEDDKLSDDSGDPLTYHHAEVVRDSGICGYVDVWFAGRWYNCMHITRHTDPDKRVVTVRTGKDGLVHTLWFYKADVKK